MIGNIFKSSSLYAIGTAARAATSIIMLPIYTRYLSPEVYGTAELLNIILDLTVLILGARVTVGLFKFYSDARTTKQKNGVISTTLWLSFLVNFFAIIVLWFAAPALAELLDNPELTEALRWFVFTIVFGTIAEMGMSYYRVNDLAGQYLAVSLARLTLQVAASVYFIVFQGLGLWGIIYSALVASGVQSLWLLLIIVPRVGMSFDTQAAKNLIIFGLPLIFGSIAMYYITFADRYFLQYFHGAAAVGIYALAYKFGFMLLSLVWAPFMAYWGAKQFDHAKEEGGGVLFTRVFEIANYILWAAATGMLLFAPPTIRFIADSAYFSAIEIVPYIVFAYVFLGWTEFHRFGLLESQNTRFLNRYNWLTVVIISVAYVGLIPQFGALGAALATLLAMAIRFVLIYRKAQSYFSFRTHWHKVGVLYGLSVCMYMINGYFAMAELSDFGLAGAIFVCAVLLSLLLKVAPFTLTQLFEQGALLLNRRKSV